MAIKVCYSSFPRLVIRTQVNRKIHHLELEQLIIAEHIGLDFFQAESLNRSKI